MSYDIVVIAGQSNAEGHGLGCEEKRLLLLEGVYQLVDKNPVQIYFDENYKTQLRVTLPTECQLEPAEEKLSEDGTHAAEFSQAFAHEYLKNGCLKPERNLLIVKAAVGGTGFTKEQWGIGNVLYTRLLQMVDAALETGSDNRIVALLWHQGEHDAFERQDKDDEEVYEFYRANLSAMLKDFRARYAQFGFPIIAGDFCHSWSDTFSKPAMVRRATETVLHELKNAAFVKSDGLLSNQEITYNADIIHFCREACYELGRRYFQAFQELKA